jgi:hypothetical protein
LYTERGLSLSDIGEAHGVSTQTVRSWLIHAGIDRRRSAPEPAPAPHNERVEQYQADWSAPDIAYHLGCSSATVYRRLEAAGAARRHVTSRVSRLDRVDWNAELVRGDLGKAVQELKAEPGEGLFVGGLTLPLALADLGLIDEYEFVVLPVVAGHGPTLFAGLGERLELKLVGRQEFRSGAVALRYQPARGTA